MSEKLSMGNPEVKAIVRAAFPEYRGRKVRLEVTTKTIDVRSWWDGGSRDYFGFVRFDGETVLTPSAHPMFDRQYEGLDRVDFPAHVVCVRHTIFCGKDCGITIYTRPAGYMTRERQITAA